MTPNKLDARYSVTREWCGYETQRFVARFCGDWIGQSEDRDGAETRAILQSHLTSVEQQLNYLGVEID